MPGKTAFFSGFSQVKRHCPRNWSEDIRPLSITKTQIDSIVIVEIPILLSKTENENIQSEPHASPGISVFSPTNLSLNIPNFYPNLPSSENIFMWTAHAPRRFLVSLQPYQKPKSQKSAENTTGVVMPIKIKSSQEI